MIVQFAVPESKADAAFFRGYEDGIAGLTFINPYGPGSILGIVYEEGWEDGLEERRHLIALASKGAS